MSELTSLTDGETTMKHRETKRPYPLVLAKVRRFTRGSGGLVEGLAGRLHDLLRALDNKPDEEVREILRDVDAWLEEMTGPQKRH